jgi:hypothetical protein
MNKKPTSLKFLRNLVICIIGSVATMSLIGYLLGGREGLINMAIIGLLFGLVGSLSLVGAFVQAKFWGKKSNYKFLPDWNWFVKKSDNEDNKPNE